MIAKEVQGRVLEAEALIDGWRLELISTNWNGYWIIQLSSKGQPTLAMLIHLDQLSAICTGLRLCIDVTRDSSRYPRAKTMYRTVAVDLPTNANNEGAITIISDWTTEPVVLISYYRSNLRVEGNVIKQGLHADDAMRLYDRMAGVYNAFSDKQNWAPRT